MCCESEYTCSFFCASRTETEKNPFYYSHAVSSFSFFFFFFFLSIHLLLCSGSQCGTGPLALVCWRPMPSSTTPSDALNLLLTAQHDIVVACYIFAGGNLEMLA